MSQDDDPPDPGDLAERRYFTVEEANRLVPELAERCSRIRRAVGRIREISSHLSSLGGAHPGALRAELRVLYAGIQQEARAIEALGGVIKDVASGLVDFWHARQGDDVFLCWKHGEASIRYFHDPQEGYAGRQPLEASELPPGIAPAPPLERGEADPDDDEPPDEGDETDDDEDSGQSGALH